MTDPRVIRFFVDVQNKTKLETNMQTAGQLPSQNSFEVRSLRVVVSEPRAEDGLEARQTEGPAHRSRSSWPP